MRVQVIAPAMVCKIDVLHWFPIGVEFACLFIGGSWLALALARPELSMRSSRCLRIRNCLSIRVSAKWVTRRSVRLRTPATLLVVIGESSCRQVTSRDSCCGASMHRRRSTCGWYDGASDRQRCGRRDDSFASAEERLRSSGDNCDCITDSLARSEIAVAAVNATCAESIITRESINRTFHRIPEVLAVGIGIP